MAFSPGFSRKQFKGFFKFRLKIRYAAIRVGAGKLINGIMYLIVWLAMAIVSVLEPRCLFLVGFPVEMPVVIRGGTRCAGGFDFSLYLFCF